MDFLQIPLINVIKSKMGYLSQRQAVLAQNVANADTPGYRAKDVAAPDFKKLLKTPGSAPGQSLQMAVTSPMHIAHGPVAAGVFRVMARPATDELNPDGNNVVIEEEMAKVAGNQGDYQQAISLYSKAVSMFKTAIGNTSGA